MSELDNFLKSATSAEPTDAEFQPTMRLICETHRTYSLIEMANYILYRRMVSHGMGLTIPPGAGSIVRPFDTEGDWDVGDYAIVADPHRGQLGVLYLPLLGEVVSVTSDTAVVRLCETDKAMAYARGHYPQVRQITGALIQGQRWCENGNIRVEHFVLEPSDSFLGSVRRLLLNAVAHAGYDLYLQCPEIVSQIVELLNMSTAMERKEHLSNLPDWVRYHDYVLPSLSATEQVHCVFSSLGSGSMPAWNKLSRQVRLKSIYRCAKESVQLPAEVYSDETDELVIAAIAILLVRDNPQDAAKAFDRAHGLIQDYVVAQAWSSTEALDLDLLLPRCTTGKTRYCEGRPWMDKGQKSSDRRAHRAFCPRTKVECGLDTPIEFYADADEVEDHGAILDPQWDSLLAEGDGAWALV